MQIQTSEITLQGAGALAYPIVIQTVTVDQSEYEFLAQYDPKTPKISIRGFDAGKFRPGKTFASALAAGSAYSDHSDVVQRYAGELLEISRTTPAFRK